MVELEYEFPPRLWKSFPILKDGSVWPPAQWMFERFVATPGKSQEFQEGYESNRSLLGNIRKINEPIIGQRFSTFIDSIYNMPYYVDAFGECGIVTMEAAWCQAFPDHFKTLTEPEKVLKDREEFERAETYAYFHPRSKKKVYTPTEKYHLKHRGKDYGLVDCEKGKDGFCIRNRKELLDKYPDSDKHEVLIFALSLEFPEQGNAYTHWLSLNNVDVSNNKAIIVGDMTPFGIRSSHVLEVQLDKLATGVAKVLEVEITMPGVHLARNIHRQGNHYSFNAMKVKYFKP